MDANPQEARIIMTDNIRHWLNAVEARCEKATTGPWSAHNPSPAKSGTWITGDGWCIAVCDTRTDGQCESNATFIAHAREDIPRLLALVELLSVSGTDADCTEAV